MRNLRNLIVGVVGSLILAACGGSDPSGPTGTTDPTGSTGPTVTQPQTGGTTTEVTPTTETPTGSPPEGLSEAADALFAAFESQFSASARDDEETMSLCEFELSTPPGSTAWMGFRGIHSDNIERNLYVGLLVTGSDSEAAQRLEELAGGIPTCGPHTRQDIGSEGVWVASRDTMLGKEGIRWSDDLVSIGGRLHDAFITTSGRFVVQVWAETRTVFQAVFDTMERPVELLEESLQTALDILGNH